MDLDVVGVARDSFSIKSDYKCDLVLSLESDQVLLNLLRHMILAPILVLAILQIGIINHMA
jgi:hypothetical protein